jgi:hypothetical protein
MERNGRRVIYLVIVGCTNNIYIKVIQTAKLFIKFV